MKRFVDTLTQAWNAQSAAPIVALYREDAVLVHPMVPEPLRGRDAIAAFEGSMFDGFSDITWRPLSTLAVGDEIAVEYEVAATNTRPLRTPNGDLPPTNRRVTLRGVDLVRLDGDGRIAEARRYQDVGSFFRQLGLA